MEALRRVTASDAPAVLAAFRSADDMVRQGTVETRADAEAYVDGLLSPEPPQHAFAIDADENLVGMVAITVDPRNRNGWFWYWMHAGFRGQRRVAVAARWAADWALSAGGGGLERLELGHRVNNPASGAIALAAGFVLEGREREKFLIDGQRIDVLTYGRLRSDS